LKIQIDKQKIIIESSEIIMPVPKRKHSRARRDSKFANKGLKPAAIAACAQCQAPLATHQICSSCGFYKGRKVMITKLDRALKRKETQKVSAKKSKPEAGAGEAHQE